MAWFSRCLAIDGEDDGADEAGLNGFAWLLSLARGGDVLCNHPVRSGASGPLLEEEEDGADFSLPPCQNLDRSLGWLWFQPVWGLLVPSDDDDESGDDLPPPLLSFGSRFELSPLMYCEASNLVDRVEDGGDDDDEAAVEDEVETQRAAVPDDTTTGFFLATTKKDEWARMAQLRSMHRASSTARCLPLLLPKTKAKDSLLDGTAAPSTNTNLMVTETARSDTPPRRNGTPNLKDTSPVATFTGLAG
jgi:hypothetical protein